MQTKRPQNVKQAKRPVVQVEMETVQFDLLKSKLVKYLLISNAVIMTVALLSVLSAFVLSSKNKAEDRYFTIDEQMRVIPIVASNQPFLSDAKLINWVNESVSEINTITFSSWRKEIQSNSDRFTKKAFSDFVTALQDSGNLSLIVKRRLNTIVSLTGAAVITQKGLDGGTGQFKWVLNVPFMINYEGESGVVQTQRLIAQIKITRVPTSESIQGVKIESYITKLTGK